ncbi:MAG: DUF5057 domain-containing protein [Lachnospiraceae bacterium]|nr:DUF5057 domain-containing protein [Lachnospiraceae bacterium]
MTQGSFKRHKRIIAPVMALAIFAGSLFGACIVDPIPAHAAKVTLKGIDEIANAHSITDADPNPKPFIILEVVPDKRYDSALGYLVGGEEPIHDGKSLKDMPSRAERERYMNGDTSDGTPGYDPRVNPADNPDLLPPNFDKSDAAAYDLNEHAFTFLNEKYEEVKPPASPTPGVDPTPTPDNDSKRTEIRGRFVLDDQGQYVPNDYSDAYKKKYAYSADGNYVDPDDTTNTLTDITGIYGNPATTDIYRKSDNYGKADDYFAGGYIFGLKKVESDSTRQLPVLTERSNPLDLKSSANTYNWQYFKIEKVTDTDQLAEGEVVYRCVSGSIPSKLDYYGYVLKNSSGELVLHPYNCGDTIFQDDGVTPETDDAGNEKKYRDIKINEFETSDAGNRIYFRSARRMNSAPAFNSSNSSEGTPTPTMDTDQDTSLNDGTAPEATPSATPTATVSGTPTPTPDDGSDPSSNDNGNSGDNGDDNNSDPSVLPTQTPDNDSSINPDGNEGGDDTSGAGDSSSSAGDTSSSAGDSASNDGASLKRVDLYSDRNFVVSGINRRGRDVAVLGAIRSDLEYDYYIITETSSSDTENTLYCIDGDTWERDEDGFFGRRVGYSPIYGTTYSSANAAQDKGPYYVKTSDADEYMFKLSPSADEDRYRFTADYTREVYHYFYHKGGFVNNEWFKRYVLDREEGPECDKLYIDVVTVTPKELSENPDYVTNANLIYFAGGRYKSDISSENAVKILNRVINEDFPVMIERSMYYANLYDANAFDPADDAETQEADKAEKVNITLLALELMQGELKTPGTASEWTVNEWEAIAGSKALNAADPSADTLYNRRVPELIEEYTNGSRKGFYSGKSIVGTLSDTGSQIASADVSIKRSDLLKSTYYPYDDANRVDVSFVHGTVFVNDDWNDDYTSYPTYGKEIKAAKIIRSDFNTPYSEGKLNGIGGFDEIRTEYEDERPIIETYGSWDDFNHEFSKATSIRYILNAHNNRYAVKSKLNILDIEPLETAQYSSQNTLQNNIYQNGDHEDEYAFEKDPYERERDYLTSSWIDKNLDFEGDPENIKIKQMGTREFIGINTDLNATYDMIYIGMDTGLMNTELEITESGEKVKTRNTVYNNEGLNGLVYSHIGDSLEFTQGWGNSGSFYASGNDITPNKKRELTEYLKAGYAILLSDDIFKYDEEGRIYIYDSNGDRVLYSDDINIPTYGMVTAQSIDTDKIDKSSVMYDFLANVVLSRNDEGEYKYFRKNVYRRGELERDSTNAESELSPARPYTDSRQRFARYLNISKLEIVVDSKPAEYNSHSDDDTTAQNYLTPNGDGSYSLDFVVRLKNDSALDTSEVTYNCKLYIDYDSDGKFEADEELGGITVNGNGADSNGRFYLHAGGGNSEEGSVDGEGQDEYRYTISRIIPEDFVGFLPWKLAFIQNENGPGLENSETSSIRSAITGFSAVPADPKNIPQIKILQITPNNGSNMNLYEPPFTGDDGWFKQVKDFDIVDPVHVTADEFIKKNGTGANDLSYFDYLCQFDMVVVGFRDLYDFTTVNEGNFEIPVTTMNQDGSYSKENVTVSREDAVHDAVLALREYTISGRSILFTHDVTSFNHDSGNTGWAGYNTSRLLRDVQGMDRFGYYSGLQEELRGEDPLDNQTYIFDVPGHKVKDYEYKFDTVNKLKDESVNEKMGFSDLAVFRVNRGDNRNIGLTTRAITAGPYLDSNYNVPDNGEYRETVTAINEGQITQYPFLITEGTSGDSANSTFEVSMTHPQYYQLDMDTDITDDNLNDDVIVWYAISNKLNDDVSITYNGNETLHEYYKALHNDVRNNYYIYTKGNVTYTGSGHSKVTSEVEQQLFVNTIVASYNSGVRAPKVVFKESPKVQSADIKGVNLPYDIHLTNADEEDTDGSSGGWINETVAVNFKTVNNNFKGSKNNLNVKYYIQVPDGGDLVVSGKHYKEIQPVKMSICEYDGSLNEISSYNVLENYRVYQVIFETSDLESGGLLPNSTKLFIQIGTDELSSGEVDALQPYESLPANVLNIYKAELFDLE